MEGTAVTYRCARCGVESAERSCFVFLKPHQNSPQNIKCVGCVVAQHQANVFSSALSAISVLVSPLLYMYMGPWAGDIHVPLLVGMALACLMYPTALVVHELAHAVTGWLVGLEIGGITFGHGPPVLRFQIRGLQIRLNAWPISGLVYLGCDQERFIRTRIWLTTLMGPLSNALLVWGAAAWWHTLAPVVGTSVVAAWIILNLMMALFNLAPMSRVAIGGTLYRSDGMALLQIPRAPGSQLQLYRFSALLIRGVSRFELEDYAGAQVWLERALQRVPDNAYIILMLGGCKMGLKDYSAALELLEPLLARDDLPVHVRAALGNNIGSSLVMTHAGELVDAEVSARADRVTAEAMASFPCNLSYRTARAVVLAATRRPEEALPLLEYMNYSSGSHGQTAFREVTRAFALHKLGRDDEAEKAAALALRKSPDLRAHLQQLGIAPPSEETQLRLLGKPVPGYVAWLRGIPTSLKEEARNVSENLNQPQRLDMGASALLKIVGAIFALIGGAAAALLVLVVIRLLGGQSALDFGALILAAILFGVSAFCLNLGYRLVLNRPNRYGSLLSPGAWRVMSVCFVMLTLFFAFFVLRAPPRGAGAPGAGIVLAPLLFAAWCWMAGRAARRNRV